MDKSNVKAEAPPQTAGLKSIVEIFIVSLKLGLTSFGGPIAHLGYFHEEYVRRRKWLDERSYADLVALCQFLPGPASSQAGIGIGVLRAGLPGGIASFLGFTLPSVIALVLFAFMLQRLNIGDAGWIHGLKLAAVAVVAQAVLGMGQKLASGRSKATIAIIAAAIALLWQSAISQVLIIAAAAIAGQFLFRNAETSVAADVRIRVSRTTGFVCLALFAGLLLVLPILRELSSSHWIAVFDSFYRSGSLVFGGGHVVLPLLDREIVAAGWVSAEQFLAGYAAAQAVPGPLFTFSSYLGAAMGGWFGALLATAAIFLPAFLLIVGALPFWDALRSMPRMQAAMAGMNAAVVGILLAAFYDPIWTSAILSPIDFAAASILFAMLVYWKVPPWIVVLTGALGGMLISGL